MNYKIIISLFLSISVLFVEAQDTTKAQQPPAYHVIFSSTAIGTNNTDNNSFVSNNNLKFNVAKDNIYINTTNSWIYGSQTSGLTNNDFFSSIDFNLFNKPSKLYYWGLGTYEQSYSLKLNDRFQGGMGLGYEILYKPDSLILVVSDGILYEETSLYETSTYETFRNSLRIKHRFVFKKIITLEGAHFWQQSLSGWDDYIIKSNTTLSVKLKSWLSFTGVLTYNKVNINHQENFLFNIGLMFEKYF